ncbi:hypothetical protein E2C01_021590 [Portunus trituberculatus]|uniref:Uncharacterized protein n=1 Tax=Portunus trituberculatus TaxID=210409 RepID=A0A5B7E4W5_PORTR|nr:hypothetical protein [Portunus trituberculatus]
MVFKEKADEVPRNTVLHNQLTRNTIHNNLTFPKTRTSPLPCLPFRIPFSSLSYAPLFPFLTPSLPFPFSSLSLSSHALPLRCSNKGLPREHSQKEVVLGMLAIQGKSPISLSL